MPKLCSAGGCSNHHYQHEKKLSFHVFPDREKEPERRQRWIWACGRQNPDGSRWKPTAKYIYLCSEHFLSGKPSKDPDNIDYVPSLFNFNKTPKTEEKNKKKKSRFNSAHFVDKNGPTYQYPDPLPAVSCSERETSKITRDLYTSKRKGPKSTRKRLRNEIPDPFTADPCSNRETRKSTRKRPTNELPDAPPAVQCDKANEKTPKSAERPPVKKSRLEHDGPRPLSIHDARPVLMYISEHQQFVIKQVFQQLNWNYQVLVLTPAEVEMLKFLSQISTKSTKNNSATTGIIDGNSTEVSTIKTGYQTETSGMINDDSTVVSTIKMECQTETSGIMNNDSTVVSTVQVGDKDEKFVIEVVKDEEYVERKPDIGVKETVETFANSDNVKETGHVFPNNTSLKETVQTFPNNANMKETVQNFPNNANMKETVQNFPNNANMKETVQTFPNNIQSVHTELLTNTDAHVKVEGASTTTVTNENIPEPSLEMIPNVKFEVEDECYNQALNDQSEVSDGFDKIVCVNEVHVPDTELLKNRDANVKVEAISTTTYTNENISEHSSNMFPNVKFEVEDEGYNQTLNDQSEVSDGFDKILCVHQVHIPDTELLKNSDTNVKVEAISTTTYTNENISEHSSNMFPNVKFEVEDEGYNQTLNDQSEVSDGFDKILCVNEVHVPDTELLKNRDANVKVEATSTTAYINENIPEPSLEMIPNVKFEVEDEGYNQTLNDQNEVSDGFDKIVYVHQEHVPDTELLKNMDTNVKVEAISTTTYTNENIPDPSSEMIPIVKFEVEDEDYNQTLNDQSEVSDGFDKILCVNEVHVPDTELLKNRDANVNVQAISTTTYTNENISEPSLEMIPNVKFEVEDDSCNQV